MTHLIHHCGWAGQPDIRIDCDLSWTTPAWVQELEDGIYQPGVYWSDDDRLYTFEIEKVTCEKCVAHYKTEEACGQSVNRLWGPGSLQAKMFAKLRAVTNDIDWGAIVSYFPEVSRREVDDAIMWFCSPASGFLFELIGYGSDGDTSWFLVGADLADVIRAKQLVVNGKAIADWQSKTLLKLRRNRP